MELHALLLAAGQSKRFGAIKQLAIVKNMPLVSYTLSQYTHPEIMRITVVLGSQCERISTLLPAQLNSTPVNTIRVPDWQKGMGASLACGIRQIAPNCKRVLLGLADQVGVTENDLNHLIHVHQKYPERIIAASYEGVVGVPAIFPARYFSELARLSGDKGARQLLQFHTDNVVSVSMPNAATDIDTVDDLTAYREDNDKV